MDNFVRLYNAAGDYCELGVLSGHLDAPVALAFSPDGGRLVSAGRDGVAIVWDVATKKAFHTLKLKNAKMWRVGVALSPDGKTLATADNVEVKLWDLVTGREKAVLAVGRAGPVCLDFSPDGKYLAVGFDDYYPSEKAPASGGVVQWDLAANKLRELKP